MSPRHELVGGAERQPKLSLIFALDRKRSDVRPRRHGVGNHVALTIGVAEGHLQR